MNSHLPVGRLAEALEAMPRERAWLFVVSATAALSFADSRFPDAGLAPLYIPIICAACWALGERAGYFVALICAFTAVMPHIGVPASSATALAVRVTVRIGTYLFVAGAIMSFRRAFDRQQHLAHVDRMTGALDNENFHLRLTGALHAARQSRETLLLAILDLDDFKAVNNRYGHAAGDRVLRTFARGAAQMVRRQDVFGRIGGDEFALLLRVHPADAGESFARILHERVSAVLAASERPVTCSMGALVIPPHVERDAPTLMNAVDQIMYEAKRSGKNAIHIGSAESLSHQPGHVAPLPFREQTA